MSVKVNLDSQYSLSWSFNCVIFVDLRNGLFLVLWESAISLIYTIKIYFSHSIHLAFDLSIIPSVFILFMSYFSWLSDLYLG